MKKYYRDFYGCMASIEQTEDGEYRLQISAGFSRYVGTYRTERGARIAMARRSDSWERIDEPILM